jgi:hypothetical protein
MRKLTIWTIAPATLTLSLLLAADSDTAAAKKTSEDCTIGHKVCYRGCGVKGTSTDLGERCRDACDIALVDCHRDVDKGGGKGNRPQGGSGSKGGGVAKDPTSPPKSTGTRSPKSGTWHGPVAPPKSGPVWHGPTSPPKATPKTGAEWHGPTPGPSGGVILKSGGKR